jgi:5'-AMP-activated protein kinase catalytic alpha subunit
MINFYASALLEMAEKVRREINILKMCTHPHIIRLYEVIDTPSDIFVVMEFVSGGELFDYIVSRGRLPPDEARHFFHQVCAITLGAHAMPWHRVSILMYAADRGWHRVLSPSPYRASRSQARGGLPHLRTMLTALHHIAPAATSCLAQNLLLDADNNIKIADFGLSNVAHDGDFLRTSCGSPNYAAPEVISGNLYAGPEVDVWSCGVILYALLCGTLPFDDESIPNLFKKIKSGMYSLPSHLSQSARELILRMLVVDPIKRISISEVRAHPWYQHKLPAYLALPPALIEMQERSLDPEIVDRVCQLPIRGVCPAAVAEAVMHKAAEDRSAAQHELKVAYELLLDEKRHKKRIEDVVLALQDASATPPGSSPRMSGSMRADSSMKMALLGAGGEKVSILSVSGPGGRPAAPPDPRDLSNRRRRWYLGIQSKKDPAHVMNEVYKAMQALKCVWHQVNNYRVLCLWSYTSGLVPKPSANAASLSLAHLLGSAKASLSLPRGLGLPSMARANASANSDSRPSLHARHSSYGANSPRGNATRSSDVMQLDEDGADNDTAIDSVMLEELEELDEGCVGHRANSSPPEEDVRKKRSKVSSSGSSPSHGCGQHGQHSRLLQDSRVKIALSLYKVQQNIYLLDFQRVEGDAFGFMKLCAFIITELKNLSAASRATSSNPAPVPSIPILAPALAPGPRRV